MAETLRPEAIPVSILSPAGAVVLTTPGLTGTAEVYPPASPGMRAAEDATENFLQAIADADLSEQLTVQIRPERELDSQGGTRAGGGGSEILLEVPAPGEGFGQLLLYTAEDGSLSWHLPSDIPITGPVTRGDQRRTYRIPRAVVPPEAAEGTSRGLIGAIGTKLLKVLIFPLIEPALGRAANHFAGRWEAKYRPAGLVPFGAAQRSSTDAVLPSLTPAQWADLGAGPALLLVHGTFSTARGAFGGVPEQTWQHWETRYQGRIFAFEHPSVSVTPRDNIAWVREHLQSLSPGPNLVLDVLTHSRGGLVGRALAERGSEIGLGGVKVRSLVMVAPPNAGTALADKAHLSALLDRVTNLVQFLPSAGVTDAIGAVVSVVKQLAVGAFGGLEGIMSMNPGGTDLADFNRSPGSQASYRVVTADFEPPEGSSLARIARDKGTDLIFKGIANDLVVPTEGAYELPSTPNFPVHDRLVLPAAAGVDHSSFFANPQVNTQLQQWLQG